MSLPTPFVALANNSQTTKRKAQNRAAQRAFRERKENHVKVLEARVSELEKQNNSQSMENQYLKAQLAKLRSGKDMSFAQSNDFTFDFPPPSMSSRSQSIGSSAVSPNEKVPARSDCPSLCSSDTSPQSTIEKDFNAAAMPHFSRVSSYPDSQYSPNDSGFYSASSNPLEAEQKPTPESDTTGQDNQFVFSESFLSQTPQYTFNSLDYRDNNDLNSFDVDPPLFDTSLIGFDPADLTEPSSELFGMQPPAEAVVKTEPVSEPSISPRPATLWPENPDALRQIEYEQSPQNGCPEVWRKIVTHPQFASFDLDELCDMFSKKNKCGQTQDKFLQEGDWERFDKKLDEFAEKSKNKLML